MRIAVCLSGQLRQWKLGAKNQKWFWTTLNRNSQPVEVQVDYFHILGTTVGIDQEYLKNIQKGTLVKKNYRSLKILLT